MSTPISIARFVLAGDRCAPDAAAAPARLGLGLDCEAARIVASPSVDRALLSTIASGSVAAAAEAPGCAAAASAPARALSIVRNKRPGSDRCHDQHRFRGRDADHRGAQ